MDFYMDDFDFMESGDDMDLRDVSLEREELQMAKMVVALESAEDMYELSLREAELKCYAESGSDDDFMSYCEAAGKDLEQKTDGIIKKLWQKVVSFFEKLKEKFFGKDAGDLPDDAKVHMPKIVAAFLNKLGGLWSGVKGLIANSKQKLSESSKWQKFMALTISAVAAIGGTAFVVTRVKKGKAGKAGEQAAEGSSAKGDATMSGAKFKAVRKVLEGIVDFVKGIGKKKMNSDSGDADTAKEMSSLGSHLSKLLTKMSAPFRAAKNAALMHGAKKMYGDEAWAL